MTDTITATPNVNQTVLLECGHQFGYRIGAGLAESGFARPGVAWCCRECGPDGGITRTITTVDNATNSDEPSPTRSDPTANATRRVTVGDTVRLRLPSSEVCLHLRLAEQVRTVRVLKRGAQILDDAGAPHSFPITHGEAGIYRDAEGLYTHPHTEPEE